MENESAIHQKEYLESEVVDPDEVNFQELDIKPFSMEYFKDLNEKLAKG